MLVCIKGSRSDFHGCRKYLLNTVILVVFRFVGGKVLRWLNASFAVSLEQQAPFGWSTHNLAQTEHSSIIHGPKSD